MHFSTYNDVQAPIDWVFRQFTDFSTFERQALRRGAAIRRLNPDQTEALGAAWDVRFQFRGKDRQMRAEISRFDPPNGLTMTATSPNLGGMCTVDLVALSRTITRMTIRTDITANSLSARLLLQSLRLAKAALNKRYETTIATFAGGMQDRYLRRSA
jgi:uncharacterized protein YndB with AHSA1/START domain